MLTNDPCLNSGGLLAGTSHDFKRKQSPVASLVGVEVVCGTAKKVCFSSPGLGLGTKKRTILQRFWGFGGKRGI